MSPKSKFLLVGTTQRRICISLLEVPINTERVIERNQTHRQKAEEHEKQCPHSVWNLFGLGLHLADAA
jgi:hypothetical protein